MHRNLREGAWMARCSGRGELSPFAEPDLRRLRHQVGVHTVDAGAPLMFEGKPVPFVGVIHDGDVELYSRSSIRRVVLQVLRRGDIFGDIPFLCRVPAPFSARALSEVTLTQLKPDTLWSVMAAQPHLCEKFLFSMATRLQRMQHRLLELTAGDLRTQVTTFLLDETGGEKGSVYLTQATLAELLAATRPSVNSVLKQLEGIGALELSYRHIKVVDPSRLRTPTADTPAARLSQLRRLGRSE